ncbi:hypothetical protein [Bacillus sp. ES1-5]|uniref:hypothetical protein n=1 Tax=Bacillus sp. ES1-5 TaxID=1502999 RepID=UPI001F0CB388|nr:hypothetical protein [Bacillus sp. ES1-5]
MKKRTTLFSYLFLFIAVIAVMIEYLFISSHFLKYILVVEITFPIIKIILGTLGKPRKQKIIAITLNSFIFILFSSLGLLNLWIMIFSK